MVRGRFPAQLPLDYSNAEVFPVPLEWDPVDFTWKRVGFMIGATAVTVWIWEGTSAVADDVDAARAVVASVEPAQGS